MGDEEKTKAGSVEAVASKPFNPADYGYTVYEKWEWPKVIYKGDDMYTWMSMAESYYRSAFFLIKGVAERELNEEVEGVAGVFLFRHYLELALKRIVLSGRMLERPDKNAAREEVKAVARTHDLEKLWKWVLADAEPKIDADEWDALNIASVEKCILDFDSVDKQGFAFRYHGEGGEVLRFDFAQLLSVMEKIYQVLEHLLTYLVETHAQNEEWESIQASW